MFKQDKERAGLTEKQTLSKDQKEMREQEKFFTWEKSIPGRMESAEIILGQNTRFYEQKGGQGGRSRAWEGESRK